LTRREGNETTREGKGGNKDGKRCYKGTKRKRNKMPKEENEKWGDKGGRDRKFGAKRKGK
jgi:hypothetical protein